MHVVMRPRFADSAHVVKSEDGWPTLVINVADSVLSVRVDQEPGSAELAAQFARDVAAAALRFAQRCDDEVHERAGLAALAQNAVGDGEPA